MKQQLTKIVATLGPGTSEKKKIRALSDAGVNVFRLNFSHGTHETHQKNYDAIREISVETNQYFSVLADLQGPKLRVGEFENEQIQLEIGDSFRLDMLPEKGICSDVYAENGRGLFLVDSVCQTRSQTKDGEIHVTIAIKTHKA